MMVINQSYAIKPVAIGANLVGPGQKTYIIAEIGINHNGEVEIAKRLINVAAKAGCDAVKFQKRYPPSSTPLAQRDIERDTPWGRMKYIDYRMRMEFDLQQYRILDHHCREQGLQWFASCWDLESIDFMEQFTPPCYKIASATLTDHALLRKLKETGRPIILSTGMSTTDEINKAVALLNRDNLLLAHSTSTYPCPVDQLNLRVIQTLQTQYLCPVGYSGHEVGLATTWAAVAMGACFVERHITLDRTLWGSDQAASVEPGGLERLVKNIRDIELALGDGIKKVYDSELIAINRLRKKKSASA